MSRLLDPMHRRYIDRLGIGPGARTLEVGCGNGSISAWLAGRIAPGGRAVAVDLDLSLLDADVPGLECRQADILAGPVGPGDFDLVTARAVLHHVADAEAAVVNLVTSAKPGGTILLIEPDFLPVSIAEPPEVRAFWQGWLAWSREQGIDYFIGRRLPAMLSRLGLKDVGATAETALYNGGSLWLCTGGRRSSSCALAWSTPASWTTGPSTCSSPSAPIRRGGRRPLPSQPSTAAPLADHFCLGRGHPSNPVTSRDLAVRDRRVYQSSRAAGGKADPSLRLPHGLCPRGPGRAPLRMTILRFNDQ